MINAFLKLSTAQLIGAIIQFYVSIKLLHVFGADEFASLSICIYYSYLILVFADLNVGLSLPKKIPESTNEAMSHIALAHIWFFIVGFFASCGLILFSQLAAYQILFTLTMCFLTIWSGPAIAGILGRTSLYAAILFLSRMLQLVIVSFVHSDENIFLYLIIFFGSFFLFLLNFWIITVDLVIKKIQKVSVNIQLIHCEFKIFTAKLLSGIIPNSIPAVLLPSLASEFVAAFSVVDRIRRTGQMVLKSISVISLSTMLRIEDPKILWDARIYMILSMLKYFVLTGLVISSFFLVFQDWALSLVNINYRFTADQVVAFVYLPLCIVFTNFVMSNIFIKDFSSAEIFTYNSILFLIGGLICLFLNFLFGSIVIQMLFAYELISLFVCCFYIRRLYWNYKCTLRS